MTVVVVGSSDRWLVIKVEGDTPHYRLMLTWYDNIKTNVPGYWTMHTIKDMQETASYYKFKTINDKLFNCTKEVNYGTATFGDIFLMTELPKQDIPYKVMEHDTDWNSIDWQIYNKVEKESNP